MSTRILKIRGRTGTDRQAKLRATLRWMSRHGWHLVDYSDEEGSALFERPADAPPLRLLDGTRWLPAPGWFKPQRLLPAAGFPLRRVLVFCAIGAVVGTMFLLLLVSAGSRVSTVSQEENETWRFVTAESLNVRGEPSAKGAIVGALYKNQRVLLGSRRGAWVQILHPVRGFVARKYLQEQIAR